MSIFHIEHVVDTSIKEVTDECTCRCHTEGGRHIQACCHECPKCKKNIRIGATKEHAEKCK